MARFQLTVEGEAGVVLQLLYRVAHNDFPGLDVMLYRPVAEPEPVAPTAPCAVCGGIVAEDARGWYHVVRHGQDVTHEAEPYRG